MSPRPDPPARNRQNVLNAAATPEQLHIDTADPVADDAATTDELEDGDTESGTRSETRSWLR